MQPALILKTSPLQCKNSMFATRNGPGLCNTSLLVQAVVLFLLRCFCFRFENCLLAYNDCTDTLISLYSIVIIDSNARIYLLAAAVDDCEAVTDAATKDDDL